MRFSREVLEGDKADSARRQVARAAGKALRAPRVDQAQEGESPDEDAMAAGNREGRPDLRDYCAGSN
jgi:hypothetical protein